MLPDSLVAIRFASDIVSLTAFACTASNQGDSKNNQIVKDQCPVELFTMFYCIGGVFSSSRDLVCHVPIIP
jgi:hypothetical protein